MRSGSTTGRGIKAIAMGLSYAIYNAGGSSHSLPTAKSRPSRLGLGIIPKSWSSRAIVEVGEAASRALPNAIQVADRWHLIENASAALLDVVRKSMRLIRNAIGATTIDRELLTSAECLQHDGYLRREEANAAIMAMAKDGVSIKQIVRQTGHSRKTVRQVIRGGRADVFRK